MSHWIALLALLAAPLAQARWEFLPAEDVAVGEKAFHHLEAAGGRALAMSGGHLALVWEDDRSGTPRCYLAVRSPGRPGFAEHGFGQGECYAPAVAGLGDGRFAVIWEDAGGVRVALAGEGGLGSALALAPSGGQGVLAWRAGSGLFAAWSSPDGRWRRVWRAALHLDEDRLALAAAPAPGDDAPPADDQTYPVLAANPAGLSLAWEDRRLGHTVIYASQSQDGEAWGAPARISQNPSGRIQGTLGRGTGAMRPALAAYGARAMALVWLDKRDFLSGYDVYASLSQDGGQRFGANMKAQDSFGDAIAQWHATAAGNPRGDLVIAWDDDRDGSSDIWLTWLTAAGFAENVAPPPASGPGSQTDPVLALDADGNLHLAWLQRGADGHSSVRYSLGKRRPD